VTCPTGAPCRFKHIAAGFVRTCAIDTNGDAWCWGFGSTSHARLQATLANATVKFQSMAVGFAHVCAISDRNDLWCSGENHFGQIGLPRATQSAGVGVTTPVRILVPMRFRRVVAGVNHTCAILTDNSMACFGDNREHQLTSPSAPPFQSEPGCTCTSQPVFQQFGVNVPVEHAAAGPVFTCARLGPGETRCWGINAFGLSFPAASPTSRLAAGDVHLCGVVNQTAMCVGNGFFGQVGNGSMGLQSTPVQVTAPPAQYTEIAAGAAHSCGLTPDGYAHCWGRNGFGQLGIGTTSLGSLVPVRVTK
jgi:alpha-tubulin suppressor-like RCC1 family protein